MRGHRGAGVLALNRSAITHHPRNDQRSGCCNDRLGPPGLVVQVDDPLFDRGLVWQLPEPFLLGLVDRLLGGAVVAAQDQAQPDECFEPLVGE